MRTTTATTTTTTCYYFEINPQAAVLIEAVQDNQ